MTFFHAFLLFVLWTSSVYANTSFNTYFNSLRKDPNALYSLLHEMPKGGELHYHLAGGVSPEVMLAIAAKHDYCIDKNSFVLTQDSNCRGIKTNELTKKTIFYQNTLRAWSMKDFIPGQESGHDHFFNTFHKFMPIIQQHSPELLADIMQRASNQHELYLELMIMPDNAQSTRFAPQHLPQNLQKLSQNLLKNKAFLQQVDNTVQETAMLLKEAKQILRCKQAPNQAVCKLKVKFQYYVLREQPIEKVFVQALHGFAAVTRSPHLVAINLVQPEDGLLALKTYHQQMQLFNFMHKKYPEVPIALHAGELAVDAVEPQAMRFHIREAIELGHAKRIGHGSAITYEDKANDLLKTMAAKGIAVEVNLTSNQAILNLFGKEHPLQTYLKHQVPVVLSTDDEGILRTNLTQEYVKAVTTHHLDYNTLKTLNRNSLTYSFLPGKSLWQSAKKAIPVTDCQSLNSSSCLAFIKSNPKATLQWQLEQQLNQFETKTMKQTKQ